MRRALANGEAQTAESLLAPTFSVVDRAAKWGIIKRNAAARYKSRLHNRLKALSTAA
jgi:small subunit ribosomal protein S20